jgi:hypothetical protein
MTATTSELLKPEFAGQPSASPDDFVQAVRRLLASEEATAARLMVAQGALRFPEHPWLARANRILNPSRITSRPASAPDRSGEFAWLKRHAGEHRGQWVALLGDELLTSGDELEHVLREVRRRNLEAKPLVHHIG